MGAVHEYSTAAAKQQRLEKALCELPGGLGSLDLLASASQASLKSKPS